MKVKFLLFSAFLFIGVLALPLVGSGAESEFVRVGGGTFLMGSPGNEYLRRYKSRQVRKSLG